jgi:hypothetical protein
MDKASSVYGAMESLGKTMKIQYELEQGAEEATAALSAHDALFDYSLVLGFVKYLRRSPIGIPFATFYTKMLARAPMMAIKHPARFAMWSALPQALSAMWIMQDNDVEDEDVEALMQSMPEWIRQAGHAFLWPERDASGRWVVTDFSYLLPWATPSAMVQHARKGEVYDFIQTTGLFGAPLASIISFYQSGGIDPFTKRQIIKPGDPPQVQFLAALTYMWNMNMPTTLGMDFNNPGMGSGTLERIFQSATGKVSTGTLKRGEQSASLPQALGRLLGINLYPIDPELSRSRNIYFMKYDIDDTMKRLKRRIKSMQPDNVYSDYDPETGYSEKRSKEVQSLIEQYSAEIDVRRLQMEEYRAKTYVHPNLARQFPEE